MVIAFADRPKGHTLLLFDVDETLSKARRPALPQMLALLRQLREHYVIGYVGGSDLLKQQEQLGADVTSNFDFCFPENGLTAFKLGQPLATQSFINWLGEEKYKKLVNYLLIKIAHLDIPIKRGTFIEFRNGMINVSPIGRNATVQERNDFEQFDKVANVRKTLVEQLKTDFAEFGLTYSIGGQISFDVFPRGWDKTYCLNLVEKEGFKEIHFFGDKTYLGGNDYEIFNDPRVKGHTVKDPDDTMRQCQELFLSTK